MKDSYGSEFLAATSTDPPTSPDEEEMSVTLDKPHDPERWLALKVEAKLELASAPT